MRRYDEMAATPEQIPLTLLSESLGKSHGEIYTLCEDFVEAFKAAADREHEQTNAISEELNKLRASVDKLSNKPPRESYVMFCWRQPTCGRLVRTRPYMLLIPTEECCRDIHDFFQRLCEHPINDIRKFLRHTDRLDLMEARWGNLTFFISRDGMKFSKVYVC